MSHYLKQQDQIEIKQNSNGLTLTQTDCFGEISRIFINNQNVDNFLELIYFEITEKTKK